MPGIITWYLHGIGGDDAPSTLADLRLAASRSEFEPRVLLDADKWDFLIREGVPATIPGFVPLGELASTKRGLATGANDFFHISAPRAVELNLRSEILTPCVGKATDIRGFDFTNSAYQKLVASGRRVYFLQFGDTLSEAERAYIAFGEQGQLNSRYLCAVRHPWYSGEKQTAAPIWAAVFGRQGLRFIHNRARALTLTTFHCVYPHDTSELAVAALIVCLNAPSTQAKARAHTRVYGGGLLKFEPRDLLEIMVPDFRCVGAETIQALARHQALIAAQTEEGGNDDINWSPVETLIREAASEAARHQVSLAKMPREQTQLPLLRAAHKRRVARDA